MSNCNVIRNFSFLSFFKENYFALSFVSFLFVRKLLFVILNGNTTLKVGIYSIFYKDNGSLKYEEKKPILDSLKFLGSNFFWGFDYGRKKFVFWYQILLYFLSILFFISLKYGKSFFKDMWANKLKSIYLTFIICLFYFVLFQKIY